ncbi:O-antigen ligase family protein [Psychrobacillus sp. L3]|uniref:O-antigen ligase family protein n=1 Tax=Psychrobacillus sp. L3 TaxID=3236891 RepID=UPI0036F3F67F
MSRLKVRSMNIARDEKEDMLSIKKVDRMIFWLFLGALTLVPLVIGAKANLFVSPLVSGNGITSSGYQLDFFTYFKFVFLIIFTVSSLMLFLYKTLFLNYKIKMNLVSFSLLAFLVALTLSVLLAEYKSIALWGLYDRYDGALTFICYAVLMFIALHITYPKNTLNKLVYALYPFVWINVLISLLNLYGINILQNAAFKKVFTVFLMDESNINEWSVLTGTLNQWNYMSGYSAVMAIIFLTLVVFYGSIKVRIINLLTSIAAFSTILASISTSGFVSLIGMMLLLITLIFLKQNRKKAFFWLMSFLLLASFSTVMLAKQNPTVWTESFGFFVKTNPFAHVEGAAQHYLFDQNKASASEVEGAAQHHLFVQNKASASDNELKLPELPERSISGGSGRIYIWENMIPLIKKRPLFGYGLDTLTYHFPQNDINKRDGFWDENTIVDKPHNLYIGILYGTGLLGLLCFIAFVIIYTLNLSKYVIKDMHSPIIWALALGWGSFLIQALFNDSVIGATFVPLLATSIAYAISNRQLEEEIS